MSQASWIAQRGPLLFLAAILAALVPLLLLMGLLFLTPLLLASVLAIVINPARQWLSGRIHRPALATALITLATVLTLGGLFFFAGMALTRELTAAYDALSRRSLEEGGWPALVTHTMDRVLDAVANRIPINREEIQAETNARMKAGIGYLLKNVGVALGGLTSMLFNGLLMTLFLYFLLRYGEEWVEKLTALLPLDEEISSNIFQTVKSSVVGNVYGVLAVATAQGMLLSAGFWIVGLRSPALWGAVGGLASIIPVLGCPLVWVPVVIAFVIKGAYGKALFLALWGALAVGSVDNVLRALVVGAHIKQHPVLIGLSMMGGTYAFGPLGILMGPLVVSFAAAVLIEIQKLTSAGEARVTLPAGRAG
ncbi:MAG TPA: AI-2E family transporter [Bryobacteraceae bacterium]|nr:AI-2E family transporter [Bryobacteraceae bacterium]